MSSTARRMAICRPMSWPGEDLPVSVQRPCSECGQACSVTPATLAACDDQGYEVTCAECALRDDVGRRYVEDAMRGEFSMTKDQVAEAAEYGYEVRRTT